MGETFDPEKIIKSATCRRDEHGIYCVRNSEYDRLIAAAETEGEAWKLFFEHLDDALEAVQEGTLVGFKSLAAKELGRKGGAAKTVAKQAASRTNGAKGGRPRKQAV